MSTQAERQQTVRAQLLAQVRDAIDELPDIPNPSKIKVEANYKGILPDRVTVEIHGKDGSGDLSRRKTFKFRVLTA